MAEWKLNDKEYQAVTSLAAAERYQYLLKRCADWEAIWSLASDDGWVLASDGEGHECTPVWPHSRYAEACVSDNWSGASPRSIDIHEWIEHWLPGLEKDGRLVEAFPTSKLTGVFVAPCRMRDDLLYELAKVE